MAVPGAGGHKRRPRLLQGYQGTNGPLHHGGEVAEARVREADGVRGGHDQNLRQLPLLQPQRLALLPVCRSSGELLCPKAERLQSQQIVMSKVLGARVTLKTNKQFAIRDVAVFYFTKTAIQSV